MNKVLTYEQYKETIAQAKLDGYSLSNNFFLPAAIREKIAEASLSFHSIENGLLMLDDCGDFYRCYYYLSRRSSPGKLDFDKPAVIELPFNSSLNDNQLLQVSRIEAMGFRLGRESAMMSCPADGSACCYGGDSGICTYAKAQDAPQILQLLYLCFDPLYAFLPTLEQLLCSIAEDRVIVIRDGDKIAAALVSSFEKGIASIRQVAVDPQLRGKGYGKDILCAYHKKYLGEAASFQHWVDINNTPAVNMYQSAGYSFSHRRANEYILK